MKDYYYKSISAHRQIIDELLKREDIRRTLEAMIEASVQCFSRGGRLLFCGNGGSAADAQHLAAELSGRYYMDRKALDAEALHVNTSYITAVGNDYDFHVIYERSVEAKGRKGDILIALSTSGSSENVLRACKKAKEMDLMTFGITGEKGHLLNELSDLCLLLPSSDTARIQEATMLIGHILCEQIESRLFS